MVREGELWTCFTCGTRIDPRATDVYGKSMAYYMHAGHWKPAGLFKAIKYSGSGRRNWNYPNG